MIVWDGKEQRWGPTVLGVAVMASSMDPDVSLEYIQVTCPEAPVESAMCVPHSRVAERHSLACCHDSLLILLFSAAAALLSLQ